MPDGEQFATDGRGAPYRAPVIIPPTVGRVVWFYKFTPAGFKGPLAGHVARVNSESSVNLMVIDELGSPRPKRMSA